MYLAGIFFTMAAIAFIAGIVLVITHRDILFPKHQK